MTDKVITFFLSIVYLRMPNRPENRSAQLSFCNYNIIDETEKKKKHDIEKKTTCKKYYQLTHDSILGKQSFEIIQI